MVLLLLVAWVLALGAVVVALIGLARLLFAAVDRMEVRQVSPRPAANDELGGAVTSAFGPDAEAADALKAYSAAPKASPRPAPLAAIVSGRARCEVCARVRSFFFRTLHRRP